MDISKLTTRTEAAEFLRLKKLADATMSGQYPTGIEAEVCADNAARQALGVNKYGTTVADNPLTLREWLVHRYNEVLDDAVYTKRAIAELDKQSTSHTPMAFSPVPIE